MKPVSEPTKKGSLFKIFFYAFSIIFALITITIGMIFVDIRGDYWVMYYAKCDYFSKKDYINKAVPARCVEEFKE